MRLHIERAGAQTTVQDLGRAGHQAEGVTRGGAADIPSFVRGNILLGNGVSSAALEMTLTGDTVRFEGAGAVVLTGGDLRPRLNGTAVPMWTVLAVCDGDVLSFGGACGRGIRAYLCVGGGIDVPPVLGSRSTCVRATMGGVDGRAIVRGDVLETGEPWIGTSRVVGFECPVELRPELGGNVLRAVTGPQDDLITRESVETFFSSDWTVTPKLDRMGARLSGPALSHTRGADIVSDAVPYGAVQVPGDGQPIVMLADRQTTGGYVKIAVVHALDAARLAQKMPGNTVRFASVTQEEGAELSRSEARKLGRLRAIALAHAARPRGAAARAQTVATDAAPCAFRVTVNGKEYRAEIRPTEE